MRTLFLMRGLPGSGKSTWLNENNYSDYTLSSDHFRKLLKAPELTLDGRLAISQSETKASWGMLTDILEKRMANGDLTFVDATHIKTKDLSTYKALADKYRYEVYIVDFTAVSVEQSILQNLKRRGTPAYVPEEVIHSMHENLTTEVIPSWIKVITPDEVTNILTYSIVDLSSWKKIHHIGDLQSCYKVLEEYLNGALKEDEFYIFVGDYFDRGEEHAEVLRFLLEVVHLPNVVLIEGNHEIHAWNWANNTPAKSNEFNEFTKPALDKAGFDKKVVRQALRQLKEVFIYQYNDIKILVTHAGLGVFPDIGNLKKISSNNFIKGSGAYTDDVDGLFNVNEAHHYQVHGHRNSSELPVINNRSINLEGKVEFGGHLRVVTLDENGFTAHEILNRVVRVEKKKEEVQGDFVDKLRSNPYVQEKDNGNGISSFNFTRKAFYDKIWNEQTIQARGLFVHTESREIVARSYNKFFNVNELESTRIPNLVETLKFPVMAYVKENGFLGIVGYDKRRDELVIASKSTVSSDFAGWLKDILEATGKMDRIKETVRQGVSLVFEVIDPVNDPHIIKYTKAKVVLLDVIKNQIEFDKFTASGVQGVADFIGVECKQTHAIIRDRKEFLEWYTAVTHKDFKLFNGEDTEGFVLEDTAGFMFKVKLDFYSFWKYMRGVKDRVAKKSRVDTSRLNESGVHFYEWLKAQSEEIHALDIISLRELYLKEKESATS